MAFVPNWFGSLTLKLNIYLLESRDLLLFFCVITVIFHSTHHSELQRGKWPRTDTHTTAMSTLINFAHTWSSPISTAPRKAQKYLQNRLPN